MFICLLCVNYVHSTCAECTSWFVMLYCIVQEVYNCIILMLWYGRFGRRLVIRISVPSLTLCHFVHLTNKRLVRLFPDCFYATFFQINTMSGRIERSEERRV